jgi:dolichyl-diphosphooligosaccharide--protein glycosyltransferase
MVRLMLVLAPVMCLLGGVAVSALLNKFIKEMKKTTENRSSTSTTGNLQGKGKRAEAAAAAAAKGKSEVLNLAFFLLSYCL